MLEVLSRFEAQEAVGCHPPCAAEAGPAVEVVGRVLSLPEDQLDYARAKLAFDKVIDPSVDEEAVLGELDQLTERARELAGAGADDDAKLAALRTVIYESGPWNDHRPFAYDHSDPLGEHLPNKLLHHFLKHRRGQCVSMPILFLILAEKLGLKVTLAAAAEHLFVHYAGPGGRLLNLEATSGGHPARLEWFRRCVPMSDRSLETGLYMRKLTRRESLVLMATTIIEHLRAQERYAELIAVCGIALQHDARSAWMMVAQASAYGTLLHFEFERKYPVPFLIPEHLRMRRLMLIQRNHSLFQAAEALGWEPVEYDEYLEQERQKACS